jgi:hypothetical protein
MENTFSLNLKQANIFFTFTLQKYLLVDICGKEEKHFAVLQYIKKWNLLHSNAEL